MGKDKEAGYQPSKMLLGAIKSPKTGSNVRVPKKSVEAEHKTLGIIDSCLRKLMSKPYVQEVEFDGKRRVYVVKMSDGSVYESADLEGWYKKGSCVREAQEPWETMKAEALAQASVMKGLMDDPYGDATPTQRKIREITDAMKDLLLYKNQKYGDSAINPIEIFTKHLKTADTKTAAILVRLDDKLSRVKNADTLRKNDICDLIDYLYPALGLAEEAGEVAGKYAKAIRDEGGVISEERKAAIVKELGDVMWFVAELATCLDVDLDLVAEMNLQKLASRQARGKINGDGDDR